MMHDNDNFVIRPFEYTRCACNNNRVIVRHKLSEFSHTKVK